MYHGDHVWNKDYYYSTDIVAVTAVDVRRFSMLPFCLTSFLGSVIVAVRRCIGAGVDRRNEQNVK